MSEKLPKNMPLSCMPQDMQEQVIRMHHRMQEWRTKHPKVEALVFWRDGKNLIVIATMRKALELGFVHTNDGGYDMIRTMCEPEKPEPTMNMVRLAIELNV